MATWQDRFFDRMSQFGYTTIKQVADAAGLAPSTLHTALQKHGKTPKKSTMDKIALALNTTSQYLMFGNEQTEARSFVIPILSRMNILPWIDGTLQLEQCTLNIASPVPLKNGFAWYVDTPDMEPVFQRNDLLFFETCVDDVDSWDFCGAIYVLSVCVLDKPENTLMLNDNSTDYINKSQLDLGELCVSSGVMHMRKINSSFNNSCRHKVLARVRHLFRSI